MTAATSVPIENDANAIAYPHPALSTQFLCSRQESRSPQPHGWDAALAKGFHDKRYRALVALLAERRRKLGYSQAALAARLGTHQQFVSRYETGERRLDVIEFHDI